MTSIQTSNEHKDNQQIIIVIFEVNTKFRRAAVRDSQGSQITDEPN